ncbi:hypothetical protein BD289DRAFT_463536 [Coniella lustricola]|uniref:Carbohydrate esterase family 16 protein n=1 Tax=Coniella lustricola TaxID=2025994 RepID=A0A2T2ZVD8_9PEZI|nr:hypothetical protein BD289DRAFT_463536 [Coniella lustricola]
MSHIFSFGDSYTGTDFKFNEIPFPSRNFPLGNPPYPGRTSANGPNWIDYLTVKYNQSFIKTYNLAAGGATANPEMVPPGFPSVFSLRGQIVDAFIPGYSHRRIHGHDGQPKAPGYPHWLPQNTLFIIWMGINDVNGGFPRGPSGPGGTDALNKRTFKEYAKMLDLLHQHGAANFAILNVPAIERSPHIRSQGAPAVAMARRDLLQFNGMLWDMLRSFKAKHKDKANVFVYDVYKDWNTVIDHPQAFKQTARLKNTMDYCAAYQFGTPTPDYFDPACGVPANQYLWSNAMHPTDRIHELVAARIPEILLKGDQDLC